MTMFIAALSMGLAGAQADDTKFVYNSARTIKDQGIAVRPWGSGVIAETSEAAFVGVNSIRVTTRNYFQGGTVMFSNPIDLVSSFGDKSKTLQITYKPLDGTTGSGPMGGPGFGGPGSFGGPGGRAGGGAVGGGDDGPGAGGRGAGGGATGGPGGFGGPPGGQGGPGGPGGFGGPPAGGGAQGRGGQGGVGTMAGGGAGPGGASTPPALKTIRLIVTTTDGLKSEAYIPAATSGADANNWRKVGIPLQGIKGFDRTNKVVKDISFAGDSTAAFFIGDMRIIKDETPIKADTNTKSVNIELNGTYRFEARGTGGSSILKYSWDFDDSDGIQNDAEGQVVSYKFRKASWNPNSGTTAGVFIVTLTVSDVYGLKPPYSTTIKSE